MSLIVTPPDSGERPIPFAELVDKVGAELPASLPKDLSKILVALDVDGTLLLPHGASPNVLETYRALVEAGANVVIASGRGIEAVRPVLGHLQTDRGWSVCSNGAVLVNWHPEVEDGVEVMKTHTFTPGHVIKTLLADMPDLYIGVETRKGFLLSEPFPRDVFFEETWVTPMETLHSTVTTRVVALSERMELEDFIDRLESLDLDGHCEYAVGWTSWVDIAPAGCTKATGLQDLADTLGIAPEATIAVGDGLNDIEMLEWAGHGVAMGSAIPQVRRAADATTGSVENDGAAALMRALLEWAK
ncbi:MAG: hydrolase [Actinobacteria bacterium]|nr:MAG: hydrolase [Actinomycetota bacterium]